MPEEKQLAIKMADSATEMHKHIIEALQSHVTGFEDHTPNRTAAVAQLANAGFELDCSNEELCPSDRNRGSLAKTCAARLQLQGVCSIFRVSLDREVATGTSSHSERVRCKAQGDGRLLIDIGRATKLTRQKFDEGLQGIKKWDEGNAYSALGSLPEVRRNWQTIIAVRPPAKCDQNALQQMGPGRQES